MSIYLILSLAIAFTAHLFELMIKLFLNGFASICKMLCFNFESKFIEAINVAACRKMPNWLPCCRDVIFQLFLCNTMKEEQKKNKLK